MRFPTRLLTVLCLGLGFCLPNAHGADLLRAYRDAADGNPLFKAAGAARLAAQESQPQALANMLPNLQATADQARDFGVNGIPGVSEYNSHQYGVTLTQPIYNEANLVQLRQADSRVSQADADYRAAEQDLIIAVATRYFTTLAASDNLRFARAEKDAVGRELEQAKRRFEVGLVTIVDVQEAQARYDLTVADEIAADNLLSDASESLRVITGQTYDDLVPLSERMPLIGPQPARVDTWIEQALEHNPQLQSGAQAVEIARENVNLQRSGHYPTLDLVGGYYDNDSGPRGGDLSGNRVSLQLTIPLYQGGAVTSRTRQAAYEHEATKQQLEGSQRDIVRQVRNAYRGQEAAISRVKALKQALVSNRSSLEATRAGLEVGTRTIVDVLDAERELYRAERDYARARYDYVLSRLQLKQAGGQLTEEELAAVNAWLQPTQPAARQPTQPAGRR
ncbi:outer membrane protein [Plasticicumulans lactativorans]|uniref:Outer membrane protein n=1 Tax=Plasticicumulans lactativorans TaxID=1133106 RepID=A0A4R2LBQ9_9GAMM|nr:TolC family outer membrane protein [Plasticicumulans lactativorans]TCO80248.1 outer membrane protein [Plasticicumulans lactativorans]